MAGLIARLIWASAWGSTAEEILRGGPAAEAEGWTRPNGWPDDPWEMHLRLKALAPALRGDGRFLDPVEEERVYRYGLPSSKDMCDPGYLHVECWEKGGKGVWLFLVLEPGGRMPQEELAESAWRMVKELERVWEEPELLDDLGLSEPG